MVRLGISNRAALIAVATAFVVGLIGSLAIRPVDNVAVADQRAPAFDGAVPARIDWRVPIVFQTSMPVIGENPIYVAEIIRAARDGAVKA